MRNSNVIDLQGCVVDTTALDLEAQFKLERVSGIGGTDASAICRMNRYKHPVNVYYQKLGLPDIQKESEDEKKLAKTNGINWPAFIGISLEDDLVRQYEKRTGFTVTHPSETGFIVHPNFDYLNAHVDGIVAGSHVLEIKTCAYAPNWGKEVEGYASKEDVLIQYYYQIQHYMDVTGLDEAHIYVLFHGMGAHARLYKFKRDHIFISRMRIKCMDFWINNILKEVPPNPMTDDEVKALYPITVKKKEIVCTDKCLTSVEEFKKTKAEIKKLEAKNKLCRDDIAVEMKNAEVLMHDGKKVLTYAQSKTGTRILKFTKEL